MHMGDQSMDKYEIEIQIQGSPKFSQEVNLQSALWNIVNMGIFYWGKSNTKLGTRFILHLYKGKQADVDPRHFDK